LFPAFANIDLSAPPILFPAILASPQYHDAMRIFANSPSIKGALVSPYSQALLCSSLLQNSSHDECNDGEQRTRLRTECACPGADFVAGQKNTPTAFPR
jgi:hypothetical protein